MKLVVTVPLALALVLVTSTAGAQPARTGAARPHQVLDLPFTGLRLRIPTTDGAVWRRDASNSGANVWDGLERAFPGGVDAFALVMVPHGGSCDVAMSAPDPDAATRWTLDAAGGIYPVVVSRRRPRSRKFCVDSPRGAIVVLLDHTGELRHDDAELRADFLFVASLADAVRGAHGNPRHAPADGGRRADYGDRRQRGAHHRV